MQLIKWKFYCGKLALVKAVSLEMQMRKYYSLHGSSIIIKNS